MTERRKRRSFTRDFKLAALKRIAETASSRLRRHLFAILDSHGADESLRRRERAPAKQQSTLIRVHQRSSAVPFFGGSKSAPCQQLPLVGGSVFRPSWTS